MNIDEIIEAPLLRGFLFCSRLLIQIKKSPDEIRRDAVQ